jgi:prepilin-type processing-associated H-X9-DG protein
LCTLYTSTGTPPVTMGDAFSYHFNTQTGDPPAPPLGGDGDSFDLIRHRGKINIAFCDGHVETRTINYNDLQKVYLLAP